MKSKLIALSALLIAATTSAPPAHAVILSLTATGDDIMTVSESGGPYYHRDNWTNWKLADTFYFNITPGQEHGIVIHVRQTDLDPSNLRLGAFLAQADLEPGFAWDATGSGSLTSDIWNWEYALNDPVYSSDVTWYEPTSGWNVPGYTIDGPQTNGSSLWTNLNHGPVAGIEGEAMWIWSPDNSYLTGERDVWFRLKANIVPVPPEPVVPEPGTWMLMGLGALGVAARAKLMKRERRTGA